MNPSSQSWNAVRQVPLRIFKLSRFFYACVAFFTLANLAIVGMKFSRFSDLEIRPLLLRYLGTNQEGNIPAYYSSMTLLFGGMLAACIGIFSGATDRRAKRYWFGLGTVLGLMSIDEMCSLHEFVNTKLPDIIKSSGLALPSWLIWPWVIMGGLFALTIVWLYLPFVLSLPHRTRNMLIVSGAVFVSGAVGLEMVEGAVVSEHGHNLGYTLLASLEESMEMLGVAILIHALLEYLANRFPIVTVALASEEPTKARPAGACLSQVIEVAGKHTVS